MVTVGGVVDGILRCSGHSALWLSAARKGSHPELMCSERKLTLFHYNAHSHTVNLSLVPSCLWTTGKVFEAEHFNLMLRWILRCPCGCRHWSLIFLCSNWTDGVLLWQMSQLVWWSCGEIIQLYFSVDLPCWSLWSRSLKHESWLIVCCNHGSESHTRHDECLSLPFCVVLSCVGRGLVMGHPSHPRSPTKCQKTRFRNPQKEAA
jgi:hypothetical protein